jgi:crotonobetainyl-CoA:carnitine CoA-transferase CaiB-like acyl-CoA transferase
VSFGRVACLDERIVHVPGERVARLRTIEVTTPTDPEMSQSTLLDGIVVLDAAQVMAGPYCAMLLSDMGARVIKVEPPAGDSTRAMAGARGSDSPAFNAVNRGKQSIVLDLHNGEGATVFTRLCASADILIENYRRAY